MLRYVIKRLVYTSIALVVISEFQLQDPAYLLTYSCADREHHRMPEAVQQLGKKAFAAALGRTRPGQ
jgi:hypothetical protein